MADIVFDLAFFVTFERLLNRNKSRFIAAN